MSRAPRSANYSVSEEQLQRTVVEMAKMHGYLTHHEYDSRRSTPGFPDWVFVGRGQVLYRELKTATGRVSTDQRIWLEALRRNGADVDVWRPADLASGRILRELQHKDPSR